MPAPSNVCLRRGRVGRTLRRVRVGFLAFRFHETAMPQPPLPPHVLRRALVPAFFLLALPSAAAAQTQERVQPASAPSTGGTCAVVNPDGTVFDARECAELAATGMVARPTGWTILAGNSYVWKIVTGVATGTDTSGRGIGTYSDGVGGRDLSERRGGMPVALVRASDRAVLARARTAADGSFRIAVPAGARGELRLVGFPWTGNPPPAETVVCNGAGDCFDYCPLPSMPSTLSPMCVEDPGLVLLAVSAGSAAPRPRAMSRAP